jgi:hypothetical protein
MFKRNLISAIGGIAAIQFAVARAGATQYDVHQLDVSGIAHAIYNGKTVGSSGTTLGAVIWSNAGATRRPLPSLPSGSNGVAASIWGNQEVGTVQVAGNSHAVLWNGTSPPVDLGGPGTAATGVYNGVVVGSTLGGAEIWTNGPGGQSIAPAGYSFSAALGVWGTNIVGVGSGGPAGGALSGLLWTSVGSSNVIRLTPSGFAASDALGISRGQSVGWVSDNKTNLAAMWTGPSAASFVNMAPAGTTASEIMATNGTQQVGDVSLSKWVDGALPDDHVAAVWHGSASTYQLLPSGHQYATGIDDEGDIVGYTAGGSGGLPVIWVPHRLPGDVDFDSSVGFPDLLVLSQHYGLPGGWVDGDLNLDGTVSFSDLLILAQNYGRSQPGGINYDIVLVPEPSALIWLILPVAAVTRRRRQK